MALINRNIRRGGDSLIKSKKMLIAFSWAIAFIAFIMLSLAKPRLGTMFDRFYNTMNFTSGWDKEFLNYLFYALIPLSIISIIGLIINSLRHKRKYDTYSKSFIIFGIVSIIGIIYFIILYANK